MSYYLLSLCWFILMMGVGFFWNGLTGFQPAASAAPEITGTDRITLCAECPGCKTPLAYVPATWSAIMVHDAWQITDVDLKLTVHECTEFALAHRAETSEREQRVLEANWKYHKQWQKMGSYHR